MVLSATAAGPAQRLGSLEVGDHHCLLNGQVSRLCKFKSLEFQSDGDSRRQDWKIRFQTKFQKNLILIKVSMADIGACLLYPRKRTLPEQAPA